MIDRPDSIIHNLLPLLRQLCRGEYGIALGGAHAKGVADAESDVDVYLFARDVLPTSERAQLCQMYPQVESVTSWGEDTPFIQGGTDFYFDGRKVECWLRNTDHISGIITECQAGIVKHDLVTWTVAGFYNHCTLSDLHHMLPVDDTSGILARWQSQVSEYPPLLRQAIITRHMQAAKFWPQNFHYRSAVERQDIIYITGIVQQVIHNLIQVIFALNRSYFPGDKKLALSLSHLEIQPTRFSQRVTQLMMPGHDGGPVSLHAQREELQRLVSEVETLVNENA